MEPGNALALWTNDDLLDPQHGFSTLFIDVWRPATTLRDVKASDLAIHEDDLQLDGFHGRTSLSL